MFFEENQSAKYTCCEVCKSTSINKCFTYKDRHYLITDKSFDVWQCNNCYLYFLNPMPSPDELMSYYPKTYYAYEGKPKESNWKKNLVKFLRIEPSDIENIPLVTNKKILDFGCGSGWSLDSFKEKGYETYGLDPDKAATEIAAKNGHIMSNMDLIPTCYESNFFDIVRSNHSLEHIRNPSEIIKEFSRILKSGGTLFISVPNAGGATRNIFQKYWYYTGVPYHTFNYQLKNLEILLKDNGFQINKIGYRSSWQGLFGSLAIFLNRNSKKTPLESIFTSKFFRIIGIFVSKIWDILGRGDSIEIYATKDQSRQ